MNAAYVCAQCRQQPFWRIERVGDAVVSWACDIDLARECKDLQRDGETTRLMLTQAGADLTRPVMPLRVGSRVVVE